MTNSLLVPIAGSDKGLAAAKDTLNAWRLLIGASSDIRTETANYQAVVGDQTIFLDATAGNRTVTLPECVDGPWRITVVRVDSSGNTANVARFGTDTLNWPGSLAQTTCALAAQGSTVTFQSDEVSKAWAVAKL